MSEFFIKTAVYFYYFGSSGSEKYITFLSCEEFLLATALRQKDQLLSRMLISNPEYGEAGTIFSISSNIEKSYSWYLVKAQFEKVPEADASCLLEIVPSRLGRKPERFHNARALVDYVPSSNPDSPPPSFLSDQSLCDLEEEIVRDVCDYLNRHEVDFSKHDSPYSCNTEKWQLEEIVMKDCFEEFLRRIPCFHDLASRLKPRKVADPFLGNDGCLRSEFRTICSKLYIDESSATTSIAEISKESVVKISLLEQDKSEDYIFASPFIGSASSPHNTYINKNCESVSPILEQISDVDSERDMCFKELQNSCKSGTWSKHQEYETYVKYDKAPKLQSFLEINRAETYTESLKDAPPLVLESPPPSYHDEHRDYVDLNKQGVDLEPCQVQLGEPLCIFSPRSQKKITRDMIASSRLPDKISSLMLVVPEVEDKELADQDAINELSTLSKEDFHNELELRLHWDPLYKPLRGNINQLRFKESSPNSPVEMVNFTSELKTNPKKMPWENVYMSSIDASPALEITKERKPSPSVPSAAIKEKENIRTTNDSFANPTWIKSGRKAIVKNTRKSSSAMISEALDGGKKYSNINSGIDDFVLLRTGVKSSATSSCPPKAIVKAMKADQRAIDQNDFTLDKLEDLTDHREVVNVPLVGEFQNAYSYIENHIRPCLLQLQEYGCVAPSYTATNLTGDYTRFILKQEEKKKVDFFDTDQTTDCKKYKMFICLHTLVTTAELIRECGIALAIDYMKTMSIHYNKELDGALDQITTNLMKAEQNLTKAKAFHPKVVATCNYVQTWQPQPSSKSFDDKILLLIFRGFQEVSTSLTSQLQQLRGLKITTIERRSQLFPLINNIHVAMCDPANVPENFPWSSFSSFILYEDKTEWLNKLLFGKSFNIKRCVCLKGCKVVSSGDLQEQTEHSIEGLPSFDHEIPKPEIYTLIGSSKITKNVKLLKCLEQKSGIIIIEREYEKILTTGVKTSSKMCRQPDLILDQSASVIIENVINFSNEEGYKNIIDLVLSISFKCQMCSIILICEQDGSSSYSFIGEVQSNLAKFHGCLVSIQSSFPHFVVNVFYSQSVEHTASLIRKICEITRDSSNAFSKKDWVRRNWLAEECSEHERFLLAFPSLNSFSAQLMLNVLPLNTLLTLPFESLKKALPWIPENILKNFKETTETGLHVEEDEIYPIRIPQFPDEDAVDNTYRFSPVIENVAEVVCNENSSFLPSEVPSKYLNTHFPLSRVKFHQHLNHDVPTPNTYTLGDSEHCLGNSNASAKIILDDSSNYSCVHHGERRRRVRSPVRSSIEDIVGDTFLQGSKEKPKSLLRPSKCFKRANEMPDVVGVVQPKPRNIPESELRKPRPRAAAQSNGPRCQVGTICNFQYPVQCRTEFSSHPMTMYEKPQKKKKRLTYEIVPGAKNGQTRLAFV